MNSGRFNNRVQELSATEFRNTQQPSSGTLSNRVQEFSATEFRKSQQPSSVTLSNRVEEHPASQFRNAQPIISGTSISEFRNTHETSSGRRQLRSGTLMDVVREYPATEFLELSLSNRVQEHSATQFRSTATVFSNFLELGNRV